MSRRRLAAVLAAGALPWTVLLVRGSDGTGVEFVFAWGLLNTDPLHAVSLYAYLFEYTMGLPERLLAWPAGVLLYLAAAASAAVGAVSGREDRRFTAGTLALSGASGLVFTLGIANRNPAVVAALPTGTAILWALSWWIWFRG